MNDWRCCPQCRAEIARPAREGGIVYHGVKAVRQTASGLLMGVCKFCGRDTELRAPSELRPPPSGRLVFPRARSPVTPSE